MQPKSQEMLPYTIRHSTRAKRASIRVLPGRGVEVVLPRGLDTAYAHDFVRAKENWIRKTMGRLAMDAKRGPQEGSALPGKVSLRAIGREWRVVRGSSSPKRLRLVENADSLHFMGRPPETENGKQERLQCALLQRWLKDKARAHLPAWVRALERETGLRCQAVQIRLQRTRWGSCSSRGKLSLNAGLLLLPPELTRYVLLHELCHTRHLNHSPRFWELLDTLDPDSRNLDKRLSRAWAFVPAWVSK